LYLSVIHVAPLHQPFPVSTLYPVSAGVACIETLRPYTGLPVVIKPVNDLYVTGRKLGGILVESDLHPAQGITTLITGVGINTRTADRHLLNQGDAIEPVAIEDLLESAVFDTLPWDSMVETLVAKICFWHALVFNGQTGQVKRSWAEYTGPFNSGKRH
jgi:BirA family biotin operon repressor/biotin-[acetyl-CoA-carboxylase] ligase